MIQMETNARKEAEDKARKLKEEQASRFFADLTARLVNVSCKHLEILFASSTNILLA